MTVQIPTTIPRDEGDQPLWMLMVLQQHPELSDEIISLSKDLPDAAVEYHKKMVQARSLGELHGRLATALGCFGLVLVGAGLGLYFHSGHLLTAFGVALAPWLATTFLTMAAVKSFSTSGVLAHPQDFVWRIWVPNVLVVLLGAAILVGLARFWNSPVRLKDLVRRRRG